MKADFGSSIDWMVLAIKSTDMGGLGCFDGLGSLPWTALCFAVLQWTDSSVVSVY